MIKSRAAGTADLDGTFSRRYTAASAAACRHDTHVRASETPFAPGLGRFVPYAGAVDAAARVVVRITKGCARRMDSGHVLYMGWRISLPSPAAAPHATGRWPKVLPPIEIRMREWTCMPEWPPSEGRSSVATSLRSLPRGPPPGALSISSTRANVALRSSAICLTICCPCTEDMALSSIVERPHTVALLPKGSHSTHG